MIISNNSISHNFVVGSLFLTCLFLFPQTVKASTELDTNLKQVKSEASSTVFYLDHKRNIKKAYINETSFLSYGNKWEDIKIVEQSKIDQWPDLTWASSNSDPNIYYIKNGKKALVNPNYLSQFNFKSTDLVNIGDIDLQTYPLVTLSDVDLISSTDQQNNLNIAVYEKQEINPTILVSKSENDETRSTVASNTKNNLLAVFNIYAFRETNISSITLNLSGVFENDELGNIYIADENNNKFKNITDKNNREITFRFDENLELLQGKNTKIKIFADINTCQNCVNHTIRVSLKNSSSIKTAAKIIADFPINSNIIDIVDASSNIADAKIEKNNSNSSTELIIGATSQLVSKFTIFETSELEDILVRKIILKNNGSAIPSDINNFQLKINNQVVSRGQMDNNKLIAFNITDYKIKKSTNESFSIFVDAVGGAGRTIDLQIHETFILDSQNKFYLKANYSTKESDIKTIGRKKLNVLSKSLDKGTNTFKNITGSILGNFEIRNTSQKIKLEKVKFTLTKNKVTSSISDLIYLVNYSTGEIIESTNGTDLNDGEIIFDLKNKELDYNKLITLSIISNLSANIVNGDVYQLTLDDISYENGEKLFYTDKINANGAILSVNESKLYIYPNHKINSASYTKGESKVKIGSFMMEASHGDDIEINSITMTKTADSVLPNYNNGFSNMTVYINSTKVGEIIKSPSNSSYTFENFIYTVKAGTTAELSVYIDTEKDLEANFIQLQITSILAESYKTNVKAKVNGANAQSFRTKFTDIDAKLKHNTGGTVLAGKKNNAVSVLSISNTGQEDIKLQSIVVHTTKTGFSNSLGYTNLRVSTQNALGKEERILGAVSKPVSGSNEIRLNNHLIKTGTTIDLYLYVNTEDYFTDTEPFEVYFNKLKIKDNEAKIDKIIIKDIDIKQTVNINQAQSSQNFIWPIIGKINYRFNDSKHPYANQFKHLGIDIDAAQGSKVKAVLDGQVTTSVDSGLGYNYIIITHLDGLKTLYGHLSAFKVKVGDIVSQGDIIGFSGGEIGEPGSGEYSTGAHLHFEVLVNNINVDPITYLP